MLNLTRDKGEGIGNRHAQIPLEYTVAFLESWFVSVHQNCKLNSPWPRIPLPVIYTTIILKKFMYKKAHITHSKAPTLVRYARTACRKIQKINIYLAK